MRYVRVDIPVTKNHCLIAFFWKRKRDFRRATKGPGDACFFWYAHHYKYPIIGELHFVKGLIGSGMVAHELEHAALSYTKKNHTRKNEEYLCELVQVMTTNFWLAVRENKKLNSWIYRKDKKK